MPGERQILDERYGPGAHLKPLAREKLDRLRRRLPKLKLTDLQFIKLEASLANSFANADMARQLDGRLPSDPTDERACKKARDLVKAHQADLRILLQDVKDSAAMLIRALTRDPSGATSDSDIPDAVWYELSRVDEWESGKSTVSPDRADIAARALGSARELFALAEIKLGGLPDSSPSRPKQENRYMDELLRNFALIWADMDGELPPTSPGHRFFRMSAVYLCLVGYPISAKALSIRWSKILDRGGVRKKIRAQIDTSFLK